MKQPPEENRDPRAVLAAEHARLEEIFQAAERAARARDRKGLRGAWSRLETLLRAHMAAEEAHLFPALQQVDPKEAAALRNEHEGMRKQLSELGVGVDLRLVSSPLVDQFMSALRQHAKREDALAYRWASEHLSAEKRRELALELGKADQAARG